MEVVMQRLHSALQSGRRLTIAGSNNPAFSFQSCWDSGCGLHAAALALAMVGCLSDPSRLSSRRRGPEAEFWNRAQPFYLTGISLEELQALIRDLDCGLRPTVFEGVHADVFRFSEQEVSRGRPVILTFRPLHRASLHAVVAVGIEVRRSGRTFNGQTLLVVDSAEAEPVLAAYNARLTPVPTGHRRFDGHAQYVTGFDQRKVVLTGAMSIRSSATTAVRKAKPP